MIRSFLRLVFVAIALGAMGAAAPTTGPTKMEETPGAVVQMSPYEVSAASVDFQHWVKFASPHFIVYTDASPEDAARIVGEFELLHLAAVKYLRRESFKRSPTIVILPTSSSDWRKVESTTAVEWHVAVSNPTQRLVELVVVQYDWQSWLLGSGILYSAIGDSVRHAMKLDGPLWFGRGLGSFFETAKFTDDTVILGKQTVRSRTLWMKGWLPWPDFFKATSSSPEFTKTSEMVKFSGQSAAFVNYLLTIPDPIWRERLMTWDSLLQAGREPTEEAFKGVFGQDWETWQKTMTKHIHDRRKDNIASVHLTADELGFPRTKQELSVREMRELFVLAQILNQRIPASEVALDALLAKGVKTESLRELMVEACMKLKRRDVAQDRLRQLVAAGSANPAVYAMTADNVFRARVPAIGLQARLGDEADEIRELCRKALSIEPLLPEANNLLAWTEALGPHVDAKTVSSIETMARALEGVTPTQEIISALAVAQWRAGNLAAARSLAQALSDSPFATKRSKSIAAELMAEFGGASSPH